MLRDRKPRESPPGLYRRLIALRKAHPGLTSPDFHPRYWDGDWHQRDADLFGIDVARHLAGYHRWARPPTAGGRDCPSS